MKSFQDDIKFKDETSCCEFQQLSLYIHIPFCAKKCFYCDFLSFPSDQTTIQNYVDTLICEIKQKASQYQNRKIYSIFFGGGTPSLLTGTQMEDIMTAIISNFSVSKEGDPGELPEISMEMNPGTVTRDKLLSYQKAGINRISIGLQSANNQELKLLGRIHSFEDFIKTYQLIREVGFKNVNVDLMSALPTQTIESYEDTLDKVLNLSPPPEHISAYSLILEEGTYFYDHYEYLDEEIDRRLYEITKSRLQEKGYERYEISNYAIPGYECKHNQVYWERNDYLGLGLGSSSFVHQTRFKNTEDMTEYLALDFSKKEVQTLTLQEQMEEFMFLGLRQTKGVSTQLFFEIFHQSFHEIYGMEFAKLKEENLLKVTEEKEFISLTEQGLDLSNYVFRQFLK